ncbi:MAG: tRNA (adenosine(37)-N6)-threonylcarbamoyltransferase complex ATPase subunit type 1 TsaE [Patescibacteria group bacterium]
MPSIVTKSAKETKQIAAKLAGRLIKKRNRGALVVALEGELGAGKTTFIKGFSKALGIREKILSPTFVLIHKHKIINNKKRIKNKEFKNLYHIDCYRLKSGKDLLKLGIKEIFANPENIVLIEWADRAKKIVPKNAIWIYFSHLEKNTRRITIK